MALKDLVARGPKPKTKKRSPKKKRTLNHPGDPKMIDEETWFYENRKGLLVVHEIRDGLNRYIHTDQFTIPWKLVIAAAQRHGVVLGAK